MINTNTNLLNALPVMILLMKQSVLKLKKLLSTHSDLEAMIIHLYRKGITTQDIADLMTLYSPFNRYCSEPNSY